MKGETVWPVMSDSWYPKVGLPLQRAEPLLQHIASSHRQVCQTHCCFVFHPHFPIRKCRRLRCSAAYGLFARGWRIGVSAELASHFTLEGSARDGNKMRVASISLTRFLQTRRRPGKEGAVCRGRGAESTLSSSEGGPFHGYDCIPAACCAIQNRSLSPEIFILSGNS